MDWATASITVGSKAEAFDLVSRIDDVRDLRGRSNVVVLATAPGRQGGVTDVISVAVSSGGALGLLFTSVSKWLVARERVRPLKITIERDGRRVEVEVDQTGDTAAIVEQILAKFDGDRDER